MITIGPPLVGVCNFDRICYKYKRNHDTRRIDQKTKLDHRGSRLYDVDIGRFLSVDPLAMEFPDFSAYNYVLSNPIRFVDPNGEKPTPMEAAIISAHVYGGNDAPTLQGGWVVSTRNFHGVKLNSNNGFQSAIYERTIDGVTEYVYATTGTNGVDDIDDNAGQGLGIGSGQYSLSTQNAEQISAQLGADELTFTGHSLGGGLATANALTTGDAAIVFNSAALNSSTKAGLNFAESDIHSINSQGDPLTVLQSKVGLKASGKLSHLENLDGEKSKVKLHSINRVIEQLKTQKLQPGRGLNKTFKEKVRIFFNKNMPSSDKGWIEGLGG